MTAFSAVEGAVAGVVETLGPVLGTVVVLTAGITVGAVLGGIVGLAYQWLGRLADEGSLAPAIDLGGDGRSRERLVVAVAVVGTVAIGGPVAAPTLAALIRRAVAAFGPIIGGLIVVGGGVGLGAVLGAVVGLSYPWLSGSWLGDGSSAGATESEAEHPSVTMPDLRSDGGPLPDVPTDLRRRQVLGTVAAVGGAAALGGLGTSAFYSDDEKFANNQVVTGALDLKITWQEHYSDWSPDEDDGIMTQKSPGTGLTGFPSAAPESEQTVFVSDPDRFLQNTAIEAFPDILPEGTEDYDARRATFDNDSDICELDADSSEALDSDLRTEGTFPRNVDEEDRVNQQTTEPGDPLVDVSDVKPGDFGEVTFGFHLCGNPGYVWLTGALQNNLENDWTEPEREAGDDTMDRGELTDAIQAAVWYDTGVDGSYGADIREKDLGEGDNIRQTDETLLLRGSLGEVLDALSAGHGVPLDGKPGAGGSGGPDGSDGATSPDVVTGSSRATKYISTQDELFKSVATNSAGKVTNENLDCTDYESALGVDLVGTAVEADELEENKKYPSCSEFTVTSFDQSNGTVTLSSENPVRVVSVKGGSQGEAIYVFDEPVILDMVTFSTPTGQSVSNIDVCCPDDGGSGGGGGQGSPGRDCLPNSTTAYVGFEWWVPRDVGSEIQTDSVSFDLGFYTEQCRHNDGSGFGNAGGEPDDDDGDDGGVDGDGAISFLAACVDKGRDDVGVSDASFRVTKVLDTDDAGDPTAVEWAADAGLDAVVAYYGSSTDPKGPKFTTYTYDSPKKSGTVVAGADEDGTIGDEDGSPETTSRAGDGDQKPQSPAPDDYRTVIKLDDVNF